MPEWSKTNVVKKSFANDKQLPPEPEIQPESTDIEPDTMNQPEENIPKVKRIDNSGSAANHAVSTLTADRERSD